MKISAIIVCGNGRPPARLKKMLSNHEQIELIAECRSGPAAIACIREHSPDLILLDRNGSASNGHNGSGSNGHNGSESNGHNGSGSNSHIAVRCRGRTVFVEVQALDYIEAAHNNIVLHTGRKHYVLRGSLSGIGDKLPGGQFLRVNKSIIANLSRVQEVRRPPGRQPMVVLKTGEKFFLTRQVPIGEIRRRLECR